MSEKKPSKPRALDALVGTAIAAVVIAATTFGEFGAKRHEAQTVVFGSVQAPHHALRAKPPYAKPRCFAGRDCRR